jgi:hypothetical protein
MWPPLVYLGLIIYGMGASAAKYGQPKTDKYDATDVIVGPAIVFTLLYYGNFFAPLGLGR